jgi:four helix bundle protein
MKNFRTYHLSVAFYRRATTMPLARHLDDQFKRAASSIVLNLAEGSGRESPNDQRKFYRIAFGSLRECQAIITLAGLEDSSIVELADKLAAHLYKLIQAT